VGENWIKSTVRVNFSCNVYLVIDCLVFWENNLSLFVLYLEPNILCASGVAFLEVKVSYFLLHKQDYLVSRIFFKFRSALLICLQLLSFCRNVMPTVTEKHINSAVFENNQKLVAIFILIKRLKPTYMGNFPFLARRWILVRIVANYSAVAHQPGIKHKDLPFSAAHYHFHLWPVLLWLLLFLFCFSLRL